MVNMRIIRLSVFNIKKHKKEAAVLIILITISVLFMGIAIVNNKKAEEIFDKAFYDSNSHGSIYMLNEDAYRTEYDDAFKNNPDIINLTETEILIPNNNASTYIKKEDNSSFNFFISFITESNEKKISDFKKETSLSDKELKKLKHPIWMPYYVQMNMGYKVGDEFTIYKGSNNYSFQIAGFYESALLSNSSFSFKCVVSDEDYEKLESDFECNKCFVFDTKEGVITNLNESRKFEEIINDRLEEIAGKDIGLIGTYDDKYYEEDMTATVIKIMMDLIAVISLIIFISSIIMIRHKIANDIDDQMESIGVLEALGYKSFEISLSYVYEYLLYGVIGSVLGVGVTILTDPLMTMVIQMFEGHKADTGFNVLSVVISCVLFVIFIIAIALLRAREIKKYPPVVAFRKGIRTHHFGKNHFPLEYAGGNINLRMGLRSIVSNKRQNVGIFTCILLSTFAISFCIMIADIFRDEGKGFKSLSGYEAGEVYLMFEEGVSSEEIIDDLYQLEEVRKCNRMLITTATIVGEGERDIQTIVYKDFSETENIFTCKGRLPEHDNEIVIKKTVADSMGYEVGDSIVLRVSGIEKSYLITGLTNSITDIVLLTDEGYKRMSSISDSGIINVYLKDGVDVDAFRETVKERYGNSTKELLNNPDEEGSYEDRIRAKAEEQMAVLMSKYGVSNANYSIKIGDKVISGGTGRIRLKEITSIDELIEASLGGIARISEIFSVVASFVVALIIVLFLSFLVDSSVRKERRYLGIKKSMGYTSRDLRLQLVFRILPIAIPAVIIGAALVIPAISQFQIIAFGGGAEPRFMFLIPGSILIGLYILCLTYLSAGKIKKISVTELMTE